MSEREKGGMESERKKENERAGVQEHKRQRQRASERASEQERES